MPDSRETVPVALALFFLAQGDPEQTIIYGANFGRDADTIASMAGAIAGAYAGAGALPEPWWDKVKTESPRDHSAVARSLIKVIQKRVKDITKQVADIQRMM